MQRYRRYAIEMENGGYMRQEFDGSIDKIKIEVEHDPLSAFLTDNVAMAKNVLADILNDKTILPVRLDPHNPPARVVKFDITLSHL